MRKLPIKEWYPTCQFPSHPSVGQRFLNDIGGPTIDNLWTRRNLYVLAEIFKNITAVTDRNIKLQLLSAFVQTLHLCSKMVIPRNRAANRDFSGSWGRPDYLVRRRRMEQNPLDVFWRSCSGRTGVVGMMDDAAETFPNGIDIHDAKTAKKIRPKADINYGAIDVAQLEDYIGKGKVDFVITDPPYAGLVRYLPLSIVWLCWLEKENKKYKPDLKSEITVDRTPASRKNYCRLLRNAFEQINSALKSDGRLVVTFHHQKVQEFNYFVLAVKEAGFVIDKVTHQYNRRSGESNVANPYGVSATDFYVRCVKRRDVDYTGKQDQIGNFIIAKASEIIGRQNERTPYNFLFEALWPEMLQAGFTQPKDSSDEIKRVLNANEGDGRIFVRTANPDAHVGDLWWFNKPSEHISHPDRPLQDRVADSVLAILRRKISVKLDDVIGDLFKEYPNGLTPDPRTINSFLRRYAHQSQGKWKLNPEMVIAVTKHSDTIAEILKIGSKLDYRTYVGRREQPEKTSSNAMLREMASLSSLSILRKTVGSAGVDRLEWVDTIFIDEKNPEIACLWEVENSTSFGAAIYRGSNAPAAIPKFMVIPDEREAELRAIVDPLFLQTFKDNGWRFLTYLDVSRLAGYSSPTIDEILKTSKGLG